MDINTLNVCLGHLPFPQTFSQYADLMVSPVLIPEVRRLAIVHDDRFGPSGHTLSEYGQLIWIMEHIDELAPNLDYVRIFHYRRFVARNPPPVGKKALNNPWATAIQVEDLATFIDEFTRHSASELFNSPVVLSDGVTGHYARTHILEDLLLFTRFLINQNILGNDEAALFLREKCLIPACNIAIWKKSTFIEIFTTLSKAAHFVHSDDYIARSQWQRRSVGFLLERLNSFLILRSMRNGRTPTAFGYNIVLSSDGFVSTSM